MDRACCQVFHECPIGYKADDGWGSKGQVHYRSPSSCGVVVGVNVWFVDEGKVLGVNDF